MHIHKLYRAAALPAAAALLLTLGACGSSDATDDSAATAPSDATSSTTTDTGSTDTTPTEEATPTEESSPAATTGGGSSSKPVKIGKTLTDPVMGNSATIEEVVPDFAMPAALVSKWAGLQGRQVVLVKAKVQAGTKFYETFGAGDFYITKTGDGIDVPATDDIDDYNKAVKAAGFAPILGDIDEGKSSEGWMIFVIKPQQHITLSMRRLAAQSSDGKTISRKDFSLPIA